MFEFEITPPVTVALITVPNVEAVVGSIVIGVLSLLLAIVPSLTTVTPPTVVVVALVIVAFNNVPWVLLPCVRTLTFCVPSVFLFAMSA